MACYDILIKQSKSGRLKNYIDVSVAQLDRVTDYESVGHGFESLQAHRVCTISLVQTFFIYLSIVKKNG